MISLVRIALLHLLRARMVWVVFAFSLALQFIGLSIVSKLNMQFNGAILLVRPKEVFFGSLLIQLFSGFFTAAIYGIWMVPHLHRGSYGQLTHMLPLPRWRFPIAYSSSFSILLLVQMLLGIGVSFILAREFSVGFTEKWFVRFLFCLIGELLALNVVMLGFAALSLTFRTIPTFFLGLLFTTCSQLFAVGERLAPEWMDRFVSEGFFYYLRNLFKGLPPIGEFVFALSDGYRNLNVDGWHLVLWGGWYVVFLLIFHWKLRFPQLTGAGELN